MATLTSIYPTMLDLARMFDPDGKTLAQIVPVLHEKQELLGKLGWMEANSKWSHRNTYETSLGTPSLTEVNGVFLPTKMTTAQSQDGMAEMQDYSVVDPILADASGNRDQYRMNVDARKMEAFAQKFGDLFYYGNANLSAKEFTGMAARYAAKYGTYATETAENVIAGGASEGTGTCTSIWIHTLTPRALMGIYRPGTRAGFQVTNRNLQTMGDATNGYGERLVTHYRWSCGITNIDWRGTSRIGNIDVTALTKNATTGADLPDLIMQAIEVTSDVPGEKVLVCNRDTKSWLRRQITNRVINGTMTTDTVSGKEVMRISECQVLRCDSILNTETGFDVTA